MAGRTATPPKKTGNSFMDKKLAALNKRWEDKKESAKKGGGQMTLEDGPYLVKVDKVELREDKNGNLGVAVSMIVAEGDCAGEPAFTWLGLKDDDNLDRSMHTLYVMGADIEEGATALPAICAGLTEEKPVLKIKVATKPGKDGQSYTNVYINKKIEDWVGDGVDVVEAPEPDDDDNSGSAEGDENDSAIAVGKEVSFVRKGKTVTGEITEIDGDDITVEVDGKSLMIETADVIGATPEPDDEQSPPEADVSIGDSVTWKEGRKILKGVVKKMADGEATIKGDDGQRYIKPVDQLSIAATDE